MVKMSDAFPSKYLKAADVADRQARAIMGHVDMEKISNEDDDKKPVLYFTKSNVNVVKTKGLVLNKTNSKVIATAYGDDSDAWQGKEIILFMALVDFRGDQVEAIRVRVPKPQAAPAPVKAPTENPGDGFDDVEDTF
jgi:hypothetical protein